MKSTFLFICSVYCSLKLCGAIFPMMFNSKIHAKTFEGFQNLEAALVPAGTFIALNEISAVTAASTVMTPIPMEAKPSSNSAFEVDPVQAMINEIINSNEMGLPKRSLPAATRYYAGIRPLVAMPLPMGVFIPYDKSAARSNINRQALKAKLRRGLHRVFTKLRTLTRQQKMQKKPFDYVKTFNGLSPLEAVYIPIGYYIPLSGVMDAAAAASTVNSASISTTVGPKPKYYAGIIPLAAMELPGGVFIPHRMTGLPDLPFPIGIPTGTPTIGVVATVEPLPEEPDFPEVTTTQPDSNSKTTTPCINLDTILGKQEAIPTICTSSTNTTMQPTAVVVTDGGIHLPTLLTLVPSENGTTTEATLIPPLPPIPDGSITLNPGTEKTPAGSSVSVSTTIHQISDGACDNKTHTGCASESTTVAAANSSPLSNEPNDGNVKRSTPTIEASTQLINNETGDPGKSETNRPVANSSKTTVSPINKSTTAARNSSKPVGPSPDAKWMFLLPPGTQIKNVPAVVELTFQPDEIEN